MITIRTNRQWRNFSYRNEVPQKILESQFGHLKGEDDALDGFFKYRNYWYHTSDFMRPETGLAEELPNWDGYASDSYFSGTVLRVSKDGERYQVGRYST